MAGYQQTITVSSNIVASAVDVYIKKLLTSWALQNYMFNRWFGDPLGDERKDGKQPPPKKVFRRQRGGDHVRVEDTYTALDTAGRLDPGDMYSVSFPRVADILRFPFQLYGGRVAANRKEVRQTKGQGPGGVFNLVKTKGMLLERSTARTLNQDILGGYGYRKSAMLGSSGTAGRKTILGFAFMHDGPTDGTGATGNGNKDGTLLATSQPRTTMIGNDKYYAGVDRDQTDAAGLRGNHIYMGTTITNAKMRKAWGKARDGSDTPTLVTMGDTTDSFIYNINVGNQRFMNGADLEVGSEGLMVFKRAVHVDKHHDSSAFAVTAAAGGVYVPTADTTVAATALELVNMVNEGIFMTNEFWLEVVGMEDGTEANGQPVMEALQASELVLGDIMTMEWDGSLVGIWPNKMACVSDIQG